MVKYEARRQVGYDPTTETVEVILSISYVRNTEMALKILNRETELIWISNRSS